MEFLMKQAGFDKAEVDFFSNLYISLMPETKELLNRARALYMSEECDSECGSVLNMLNMICIKYNLDIKTVTMLFLVSSLESLKEKYAEKGYNEKMYFDIIKDLKYKLDECKTVFGVLGAMSLNWYQGIFCGHIVSLGRFQYHHDDFFAQSYTWKNITVKAGDPVCRFHIPSSGPMTREMRIDSYKRAFEFFGKKPGEYLVITCNSWLLDPNLANVYPEGSNLLDFMSDFDIIERIEPTETFSNCWRIFGTYYKGTTKNLPSKTSLQKNFIKWLDEGNSVGGGKGVIIFDGEKIVNTKP